MSTLPPQFSTEKDQCLDPEEPNFIAASPAICRLLDQVAVVGPHLRIAALEGESGSGKHTLARVLYHRYATRHPEIREWEFNCFDSRDWLLSHTDPQSLAGFIFLDRVDLLAAPGQDLLLRILKSLRHSGSLVLVASSELPFRELARSGQFLTELAVRLTTVRLTVPPLRERKEDLIPLADFFLDEICAHYHLTRVVLTSAAIERLVEYHWPGNLRELSSILETAVIECSGGIIRSEDLCLPSVARSAPGSLSRPEPLNLDDVINQHILRVLDLNRGNKLRTARQLGISRSTLYRLLEKRQSFSI